MFEFLKDKRAVNMVKTESLLNAGMILVSAGCMELINHDYIPGGVLLLAGMAVIYFRGVLKEPVKIQPKKPIKPVEPIEPSAEAV